MASRYVVHGGFGGYNDKFSAIDITYNLKAVFSNPRFKNAYKGLREQGYGHMTAQYRARLEMESLRETKMKADNLYDAFSRGVTTIVNNIDASDEATAKAAATEIARESYSQVPKDTGALAASLYWQVGKNKYNGYYAEVGYGGNGDPINWKSGFPASSYAQEVHEDLSVEHKNGGKAKFLEDPVRSFMQANAPDFEERYAAAIEGVFGRNTITGRRGGSPTAYYVNMSPRSNFNWPGVDY